MRRRKRGALLYSANSFWRVWTGVEACLLLQGHIRLLDLSVISDHYPSKKGIMGIGFCGSAACVMLKLIVWCLTFSRQWIWRALSSSMRRRVVRWVFRTFRGTLHPSWGQKNKLIVKNVFHCYPYIFRGSFSVSLYSFRFLRLAYSLVLKMEAACYSETPVPITNDTARSRKTGL